jgi:multicomponent Na+:H+ antiporter subunit E
MKKVKHAILLFFGLMLIWLMLSSADPQELIAGSVISLLIVLVSSGTEPLLADLRLSPKALLYAFLYVFVFLKELLVSNLDVARRVIDPRLPIKPGIVRIRTRLHSPLAKTILANSITLTPGTLSAEIRDDILYIHWIEIQEGDIEGATQKIAARFEKYLEVIFG